MSFVECFMASFIYCFPYSYRSSKYCDGNSYCSYRHLKALAKSNCNLIAIANAFKSEKERGLLLSLSKQRTNTKKDVKRIKSVIFTRSNREKSNIAIGARKVFDIFASFLKALSLKLSR